MKLSLIFLAATAAGQTTTWEPTTTTMFTTKADDWCGRHHDTLESFTRQVCLKSGIFDTGFSNGSVSKWTDIEMNRSLGIIEKIIYFYSEIFLLR